MAGKREEDILKEREKDLKVGSRCERPWEREKREEEILKVC
jgi:hypothetical protein